jgi:glutathione synthase/RimK-type ligase-like ATP-grasp enzyme
LILLWGAPGDGPLDAVRTALDATSAHTYVLDQRRVAMMRTELEVTRDGTLGGRIVDDDAKIDVVQVGAVYLRPIETSSACGINDLKDPTLRCAMSVDTDLIAWADLAPCHVINRPAAMAANNSKPYQLALIANFGFAVPETLVTTDEAAVREFSARHGSVIYKSVSGMRSIVSRLRDSKLETLADLANCPTQFQEYIAGTDVRVHVAGDTVIATEIRSFADDYRYASRSGADLAMEPAELPADVADRCRAMVRGMGLCVAGVDLRRTPAGAWYCLEVNPSPGFTFFEAGTGQRIATAIADLLIRLDREWM